MKTVSRRILLATVLTLMCVLLCSGYAGSDGSTGRGSREEKKTERAILGREFKIKYGQELTVKGQDLKVKFDSLLEDSRCPTDVTCIWAGDAKISISVRRGNRKPSKLELHTSGSFPQTGNYQKYVIRLVALFPYPKTRAREPRSDYVATLLIKKK